MSVENKGKMLFVTFSNDKELQAFRAIQLGEGMARFKPDDNTTKLDNRKAFVASSWLTS